MPRPLELCIALVLFVLTLPLTLFLCLVVMVDSPGPPFFLQTRVGRGGRLFKMIKFRKMPSRAPRDGKGITTRNDARLTRAGRFLERFKLDELPQLVNVIRGEMALVGPRPEIPKFTKHYPDQWETVLSVKPGVAGLSQVRIPHENDLYPPDCFDHERYYVEHILPDKLRCEMEYVERRGLWLDLRILAGVTGALLSKTLSPAWLMAHAGRFAMAGLYAAFCAASLYLAFLLLNFRTLSIPRDQFERMMEALWVLVPARMAFFAAMGVLGASPSTPVSLHDVKCLFKSVFYSSIVAGALIPVFFDRDLVLSAHFVDAMLLPYFIILFRILLAAMHDKWVAVHQAASLRRPLFHLGVCGFHGALGAGVFVCAHLLRLPGAEPAALWDQRLGPVIALVFIARGALAAFAWPPSAQSWRGFVKSDLPRLFNVAVLGTCAILLGHIVMGETAFSRLAILLDLGLYFAASVMAGLLWCAPRFRSSGPMRPRKAVILGSGPETDFYLNITRRLEPGGLEIAGVLTEVEWKRFTTIAGYKVIGSLYDIESILELHKPCVVISFQPIRNQELRAFVEKLCQRVGADYIEQPPLHLYKEFHRLEPDAEPAAQTPAALPV